MTINIDWSDESSPEQMPEGVYLVRVAGYEMKTAKSGAPYLSLRLVAEDWDDRHLCYDNVMLGGKGRGMGQGKLSALGVPKGTNPIPADMIVDVRVYAAIKNTEYQWKPRREVDISFGKCGYFPLAEKCYVEHMLRKPAPPANMGDDPFGDEIDDTPF